MILFKFDQFDQISVHLRTNDLSFFVDITHREAGIEVIDILYLLLHISIQILTDLSNTQSKYYLLVLPPITLLTA